LHSRLPLFPLATPPPPNFRSRSLCLSTRICFVQIVSSYSGVPFPLTPLGLHLDFQSGSPLDLFRAQIADSFVPLHRTQFHNASPPRPPPPPTLKGSCRTLTSFIFMTRSGPQRFPAPSSITWSADFTSLTFQLYGNPIGHPISIRHLRHNPYPSVLRHTRFCRPERSTDSRCENPTRGKPLCSAPFRISGRSLPHSQMHPPRLLCGRTSFLHLPAV